MTTPCPITALIGWLSAVAEATPDPTRFVHLAQPLLLEAGISAEDLRAFIEREWDALGCLPHLVDTDTPPFLIDLHTRADWCLRATIWPHQTGSSWRDVPHSHFGFIVTTSITAIAYVARLYDSFDDVPIGRFRDIPLTLGAAHFIAPATIHEVLLPREHAGVSISVRTRAVVSESREFDGLTGTVRLRTKSAEDRKRAVLSALEQHHGSP